ncbi:rhodanese-like domain-containing protein [Halobacterium sp. KA-4]|jgi:rhodanese-related sulfurtransferase|uniref:rhodanese-like domain-containing protein n=1 Tax=Halobacterium sp. KA-4 TaxID=2896367 RepID=UPI001E5F963B|nr:rhodanese-like domain-containing protein [Halobacterium sp. KA-4]MCD2200141.1 rhodanese-like domain-containing protein [Halobacterium sp. KA-4]
MDGEISADELEALLDDGEDVRIVDIRPRAAFERGHIPNSENIPFSDLPQSVDQLEGADRVVTVCPHGQASQQAARLVKSYEGLDEDARVESLASGITGWDGEVAANESDEGPDTESATESPF